MGGRRRLPLEQVLLGFLKQGEMHGYDLYRRVRGELGEVWYMGLSHVYGALKELERSGLVYSTPLPQEGRPPRKVYHITPAGEHSFLEWLRQPVPSMREMRVEFPAKLYFFRALGLEGVEELVAAQAAACRERLERMEQQIARRDPHDFNRLVFDFRRRQIEAALEWLEAYRSMWT